MVHSEIMTKGDPKCGEWVWGKALVQLLDPPFQCHKGSHEWFGAS